MRERTRQWILTNHWVKLDLPFMPLRSETEAWNKWLQRVRSSLEYVLARRVEPKPLWPGPQAWHVAVALTREFLKERLGDDALIALDNMDASCYCDCSQQRKEGSHEQASQDQSA